MDINKRIQILRNSYPEVLQGAVKIEIQDGELAFRPATMAANARPFRTIQEAVAAVQAVGLTNAQLLDSPFRSRTVPRYVREVDEAIKSMGGRVERYQYDLASPYQLREFEKIYKRDGQYYGWLTPDDTSTFVRAFKADGTEYTYGEFAQIRKAFFGEATMDPLSAKAAKRAKQFVVSKPFEMMTDPLKVGIFDVTNMLDMRDYDKFLDGWLSRNSAEFPAMLEQANAQLAKAGKPPISTLQELKRMKMAQAADTAADGFSLGSREFFNTMVKETKGLQRELATDLVQARRAGNHTEARRLAREIELLDGDIKKLIRSIDSGDAFNIRASGMRAIAVGDLDVRDGGVIGGQTKVNPRVQAIVARMEKEGWTLKGNIIPDFSGFVESRGVHVLTHAENIKFELGFLEGVIDTAVGRFRSFVTLEPFKHSMQTIIDPQTIASNPEVFTREFISRMTDTHLDKLRGAIHSATQGGEIPPEMRAVLESMAEKNLDEVVNPDMIRRARNILRNVDRGIPIAEDPNLMRDLIEILQDASFRGKGTFDMPQLVIPDAQRGEIVPEWGFRVSEGTMMQDGTMRLADAQLSESGFRWNARSGTWVMSDSAIAKFHASLGGFDLDDAMIGMVRYDEKTRRIEMLGTRQPNARYEQIRGNLSPDDSYIHRTINAARQDDAYSNAVKQIAKLSRENDMMSTRIDAGELMREDGERMIRRNVRTIEKLRESMHDMLRQNLLPFDEIRGASGGIVGDPIPVTRTSASGEKILGHVYELDDGTRSGIMYTKASQAAARADGTTALDEAFTSGRAAFHELLDDPKRYTAILEEQFSRLNPESRHAIGIWSNPRMVLDTWWGTNESVLQQNPQLRQKFLDRLTLFEQETVIDEIRDMDVIRRKTDEILELMASITAEARARDIDIAIDPAIVDIKGRGGFAAIQRGIDSVNEAMGKSIVLDDLMATDPGDARAIFTQLLDDGNRIRQQLADFAEDIGIPEWISKDDTLRTDAMTVEARKLLRSYDLRGLSRAVDEADVNMVFREAGLNVLETIAETFTDDVADERTFRTILRALQMGDSVEGMGYRRLANLSSVGEGGLVAAAQAWQYNRMIEAGELMPDLTWEADSEIRSLMHKLETETLEGNVRQALQRRIATLRDTLDPRRVVETITTPQVEEVFESLLPGRAKALVEHMLTGSNASIQMMEDIQAGIRVASGEEGFLELPARIQQALLDTSTDRAIVMPAEGRISGILDPGTVIRRRGGLETTLGKMLYEYNDTGDMARRTALAQEVNEALIGFKGVVEDWAAESSMPTRMRDYVIRGMERGGADPDVLGQAQRAATRASKVAEVRGMARGFMPMVRELGQTAGGRGIIAGVMGIGVLGAVHSVRKKDRTINEMQGPEFLPGGNPYIDDPNAHGSNYVNNYSAAGAPPRFAGGSQGVTYTVRTRGGNYDSDFVNSIQSITGGNVSGTTYDTSNPFQSESAKDRIMRMYG